MTTTANPPSGQAAVATVTPKAGTTARQDFAGAELAVTAETSTAALASRETAKVQARFLMALRRPRDWDNVRAKMLQACERPGFAGDVSNDREKNWGAAWFRKPVGHGVEGFSVRFAEEAMRAMGNLDVTPTTVYDDDQKRIVSVEVLDLENNVSVTTAVTFDKTVERRFLKEGDEAIRVRVNSKNETTYILRATDDDVFSKQQNLIAKARRTCILQLLPGDIQAECRKRILEIRHGDIAKDPDGARKKIADGFTKLNVLPAALKDYLGHDLATCTPAELADLRELWEAIRDGKTTWIEVMAEARAERGEEDPPAPTGPAKTGLDAAADRAAARAVEDDKPLPHHHPTAFLEQVAGLKIGEQAACPECGELVKRERQPGEDDDAGPQALDGNPPRGARGRVKE